MKSRVVESNNFTRVTQLIHGWVKLQAQFPRMEILCRFWIKVDHFPCCPYWGAWFLVWSHQRPGFPGITFPCPSTLSLYPREENIHIGPSFSSSVALLCPETLSSDATSYALRTSSVGPPRYSVSSHLVGFCSSPLRLLPLLSLFLGLCSLLWH